MEVDMDAKMKMYMAHHYLVDIVNDIMYERNKLYDKWYCSFILKKFNINVFSYKTCELAEILKNKVIEKDEYVNESLKIIEDCFGNANTGILNYIHLDDFVSLLMSHQSLGKWEVALF